jgi:monoterpene epsilon-lactone hydrolase
MRTPKNFSLFQLNRTFSTSLCVAAGLALMTVHLATAQQAETGTVEPDGTLVASQVRIPTSQFNSEEFNKAYIKYEHDVQNWPHPPAFDAPKAEWDKFDAAADQLIYGPGYEYSKKTYPVDIVDTKINGVHVGIVTPKGGVKPGNEHRVLLNVHGGGFFMGRGLVGGLEESIPIAAMSGIKVVTVDYRMAPYAQYPAASEDTETVYRELLKQYKPESIGMYGCSAGGMLTAQSVAWLRSKGLPRPAAVGIFCHAPVAIGKKGDSSLWSITGLPWNEVFMRDVTKAGGALAGGDRSYMATAEKTDARAYPGTSDAELAKFPPTLLVSGTRAPDMSQAIVAHAKFLKLGVDSQLYLEEGGVHGALFSSAFSSPEGLDALHYIAHWFDQKLKK